MYVDLGDVPDSGAEKIRETSAEEIIDRINMIMKPYSIDVKHVAWRSVYEVGIELPMDSTHALTTNSNPGYLSPAMRATHIRQRLGKV